MVLFAVCDARYKFTYINVGTPGKVNHGFISRYSELYKKTESAIPTIKRPRRNLKSEKDSSSSHLGLDFPVAR